MSVIGEKHVLYLIRINARLFDYGGIATNFGLRKSRNEGLEGCFGGGGTLGEGWWICGVTFFSSASLPKVTGLIQLFAMLLALECHFKMGVAGNRWSSK